MNMFCCYLTQLFSYKLYDPGGNKSHFSCLSAPWLHPSKNLWKHRCAKTPPRERMLRFSAAPEGAFETGAALSPRCEAVGLQMPFLRDAASEWDTAGVCPRALTHTHSHLTYNSIKCEANAS